MVGKTVFLSLYTGATLAARFISSDSGDGVHNGYSIVDDIPCAGCAIRPSVRAVDMAAGTVSPEDLVAFYDSKTCRMIINGDLQMDFAAME